MPNASIVFFVLFLVLGCDGGSTLSSDASIDSSRVETNGSDVTQGFDIVPEVQGSDIVPETQGSDVVSDSILPDTVSAESGESDALMGDSGSSPDTKLLGEAAPCVDDSQCASGNCIIEQWSTPTRPVKKVCCSLRCGACMACLHIPGTKCSAWSCSTSVGWPAGSACRPSCPDSCC